MKTRFQAFEIYKNSIRLKRLWFVSWIFPGSSVELKSRIIGLGYDGHFHYVQKSLGPIIGLGEGVMNIIGLGEGVMKMKTFQIFGK